MNWAVSQAERSGRALGGAERLCGWPSPVSMSKPWPTTYSKFAGSWRRKPRKVLTTVDNRELAEATVTRGKHRLLEEPRVGACPDARNSKTDGVR